ALTFRGKTLCISIALDPKEYADTKYVFEDISEVARFAQTPMLLRMTSERQVKYLRELLGTLFDGVDVLNVTPTVIDLPFKEKEELIAEQLIKVYSGKKKKVEDDEEAPPAPAKEPKKKPEKEVKEEPKKEEPKPVEKAVEKPAPAAKPAAKKNYEIPESSAKRPKGIINLGDICKNFSDGATVVLEALQDLGLVDKKVKNLKVLARGKMDKKLTIAANAFSQRALKAIGESGSRIVIIPTIK
ncbi:MAG: uL15 family ribosomal protein, partial [Clostridia bacterium]|nr:uL15 family ribosomal protein [Clostridia bacterium]